MTNEDWCVIIIFIQIFLSIIVVNILIKIEDIETVLEFMRKDLEDIREKVKKIK